MDHLASVDSLFLTTKSSYPTWESGSFKVDTTSQQRPAAGSMASSETSNSNTDPVALFEMFLGNASNSISDSDSGRSGQAFSVPGK
ncbi:hypothetical protein VKT23_010887 [Stygiomarasmius scandens]|uniref:Uncharacterized protein n=1 Tax=Marasmiellus scandens TaxID=2682957 RepID=A0ABR1JFM2_9AGAR